MEFLFLIKARGPDSVYYGSCVPIKMNNVTSWKNLFKPLPAFVINKISYYMVSCILFSLLFP